MLIGGSSEIYHLLINHGKYKKDLLFLGGLPNLSRYPHVNRACFKYSMLLWISAFSASTLKS